MRIKSPCLGCTDRNMECHSNCDLYKQFVEENKAEKAKIEEAKAVINQNIAYIKYQKERRRRNSIKTRKAGR